MQLLVARLYLRFSYSEIALILNVNDPDGNRERYEEEGKPLIPIDAASVEAEFKSLAERLQTDEMRWEFLASKRLNERLIREEELMQAKAGLARAKMPVAQQRLDLECCEWIDEQLSEKEIDALYAWAEGAACVQPDWTV